MNITFAIALGLLAGAPLLAAAPGRGASSSAPLSALVSAAGSVLLVIVGLDVVISGVHATVNLGHWLGFGHSALRIDGLAGIFLALTGVCGAATSLAFAELAQGRGSTALGGLLLLAVTVAIGTDNAFLFFLAWEGLGVCIYLLTSANRNDPEALLGGYFTAGLTKVGGAALLAAFGLLYGHTHTFDIATWAHVHLSSGTRGIAFLLFLIAFGSKVGLLPIQGALPAGYSAALGVGAASLSVALSAGFYGLWRFEVATLSPLPTWCGDLLLVVGTITAAAGIVYATTQDKLRRFLGFSTIEHAGIVLLGLGVALLGQAAHNRTLAAAGLLAATLHVCAHNLAKTLALIGAARVEAASGSSTLDPLGGLARRLPLTAGGLGVASLTLCAIPPLGGFVSEWFTFEALLQGFRMPALLSQLLCALAAAGLAFTAGIGLLAFAKYYSFIFLGPARESAADAHDAGTAKRWPPISVAALGVVILFLGTVAPWEIHALGSGLHSILGLNPSSTAVTYPLTLGPVFQSFSVLAPTWLSIVLPTYAVIAVLLGRYAGGRRGVRRAPVWVTGSSAELAAVQYRPSAYSNPIRVVLRGPLGFRTQVRELDGREELQTSVVLAVDHYLYTPLTRLALWTAGRIRRFQSGRLSTYLLYMMLALILALALIPILH